VVAGYRSVWLPGPGTLQVIDPATDRTVARLHFGSHGTPSALALGDGSVWVGFADGSLVRIDPGTMTVVDTIPVGGSIDAIGVDRTAVWTMDKLDNTVSRIDPESSKVTGSVHVGGDLTAMTVGFGSVWVLDSSGGTVVPIDAANLTVGAPFRVGSAPFDIAAGLGAVWVTDQTDGRIYRIDPATRDVSTIRVRSGLGAMVIDTPARTLWVDVP
jgi:DNA-binding beta-propeller fold protein YncE